MLLIFLFYNIEKEKIISQIFRSGQNYDHNGIEYFIGIVSQICIRTKSDKSCICPSYLPGLPQKMVKWVYL